MHIAFYCPLKPPDHPVPSGDRAMARLLMQALQLAGHRVTLASTLRSRAAAPDAGALATLRHEARGEAETLIARWRGAPPDLWLTYHPYYRAPDLLGPAIARHFAMPYVTAEASHAPARGRDAWAPWQALVEPALAQAALHLCMTARDRAGLAAFLGEDATLSMLPPFIDTAPFAARAAAPAGRDDGPVRLVTTGMMRPGNKVESHAVLAQALATLGPRAWTLDIIGDGPERERVRGLFAGLPTGRLRWHGTVPQARLAAIFAAAQLYVWPGVREAYGVSFLEASAAGLPVLAMADGGVPAVVEPDRNGWLTPAGDLPAFAAALAAMIDDAALRGRLGDAARDFACQERGLAPAATRLDGLLRGCRDRRAA